MNEKILLIIPYFGKLPNWFQVFLNSARNTNIVDFLLITDDKEQYDFPFNFKVVYESFANIQKLFHSKIPNCYLGQPYKLCDYRPAYGFVFSDYISEYLFWGHCDIDIIFGDIDPYLHQINYKNFDRCFALGHLSFYKNTEKVNAIFSHKLNDAFPQIFNLEFVKRTTYPCHFDEIGINIIFQQLGLKFFEKSFCHGVNLNFYNFFIGGGPAVQPALILYDKGKLFIKKQDGEQSEFMYLHIIKRIMSKNIIPKTDTFIITRDGFIDIAENDEKWEHYFTIYGQMNSGAENDLYRVALRRKLKLAQKNKFTRELKNFPLRIFYNLLERRRGINFLKQNGLF